MRSNLRTVTKLKQVHLLYDQTVSKKSNDANNRIQNHRYVSAHIVRPARVAVHAWVHRIVHQEVKIKIVEVEGDVGRGKIGCQIIPAEDRVGCNVV